MVFFMGLVLAAASPEAVCAPDTAGKNRRWVRGEYAATPVLRARQTAAIRSFKGRLLIPVSVSFARAATGNRTLKAGRYYYLAQAAYHGSGIEPRNLPAGLSLALDVDHKGTAYVTSFRLTPEKGTSKIAAVLTSQTRLKSVVSLCSAAE